MVGDREYQQFKQVGVATLCINETERHNLPVLQDQMGKKIIDIGSLIERSQYLFLDIGYSATASCVSKIAHINGDTGLLLYRGYPIQQLVQHSTFTETCYLLLHGEMPSAGQLDKFNKLILSQMCVHQRMLSVMREFKDQSHPMSMMMGAVGALTAFLRPQYNISLQEHRMEMAIKAIAKMPTLAASAYRISKGYPIVTPRLDFSYMENVLYMTVSNPMEKQFVPDPQIVKALQALWICQAEHEQNPSTAAVRIAASTYSNLFACISSGMGALWGQLHGASSEFALDMLQSMAKINETGKSAISRAKDRSQDFKLTGFGHRVYRRFDPRARIMKQVYEGLLRVPSLQNSVNELELLIRTGKELEDEVAMDEDLQKMNVFPNIDYYTGLIFKLLDIPKNLYVVEFTVARTAGWVSHWCEMMESMTVNTAKNSRPRQMYMGEKTRDIVPIQHRKQEPLSKVPRIKMENRITKLRKV